MKHEQTIMALLKPTLQSLGVLRCSAALARKGQSRESCCRQQDVLVDDAARNANTSVAGKLCGVIITK